MTNSNHYDASVLSMFELNGYAKRVARETLRPKRDPITYEHKETIYDTRIESTFFGLGRPKEVRTSREISKTVELVGPHWLIDERVWHRREVSPGYEGATFEEEEHEKNFLVLVPTGQMLSVVRWETTYTEYDRPGGLYREEESGSVSNLSDRDVLALDHEKVNTEKKWRSGKTEYLIWGNREPGGRLLAEYKGAGLRAALRALLETQ